MKVKERKRSCKYHSVDEAHRFKLSSLTVMVNDVYKIYENLEIDHLFSKNGTIEEDEKTLGMKWEEKALMLNSAYLDLMADRSLCPS